ncbi:MAG: hydrolase [Planctomycetota bacterium]
MNPDPPYLEIDAARPSSKAMAEQVARWCAINSGSWNATGLGEMAETLTQELTQTFDQTPEHIELEPLQRVKDSGDIERIDTGPVLVLRRRPDAERKVLLGIHYDTVFAPDNPFQTVRQAGETLHGPGVADAKGGIAVMLAALSAFEASPLAESLGWTLFLNPDEEVGSLSSLPVMRALAPEHDFGLLFEPALPDGSLIDIRKGSGNFDLVMHGAAAHAGREFEQGRNAVAALAQALAEIAQLTDLHKGVTVNVARVTGGGPANVVPDLALGTFNVRAANPADVEPALVRVRAAAKQAAERYGCTHELYGAFTSPPKTDTPGLRTLVEQTQAAGRSLGVELHVQSSGGVCDGNKLAGAGLPTLDTLGPIGAGLHSDRESLDLTSLAPRARLAAEVLCRYAQGFFEPPERTPIFEQTHGPDPTPAATPTGTAP